MAPASIDIVGFSNEDIVRGFTLKSGDAKSSIAYDLTGMQLISEVRDQNDTLILRMTSAGDDGGIVITDAVNGKFNFFIAQGSITYQGIMRYDLLMRVGADGEVRRIFGGQVKINSGISVAVAP